MDEKNQNIEKTEPGRVFFHPTDSLKLSKVVVLTLDSHVSNVTTLVDHLSLSLYKTDRDLSRTNARARRAAEKHDLAKPETFRVTLNKNISGQPMSFGYSFAGHRFRVNDDDRYIELLIRLHHEFSVNGIATAIAQLKADQLYVDIADNFPLDLYLLEMCDQIEAEIETLAFSGYPQPRVFMDFHAEQIGRPEDNTVTVEPYPFDPDRSPIELKLDYYEWELGEDLSQDINDLVQRDQKDQKEAVEKLKKELEQAHIRTKLQSKEFRICQPN